MIQGEYRHPWSIQTAILVQVLSSQIVFLKKISVLFTAHYRDVAIEIFFADGRNALITVDKHERDELYAKLASRVTMDQSSSESILGATSERDTSAFGGSFKLSNLFGSSTLHDLTQKWEKREITNFQYLMYLNAIAGRSYNGNCRTSF